ncbi:probable RNA polymerase II nuclear localization protein SLC7A6OS [Daphnia carinata]|uniref:probable RNA polymerase II nuclear localization protein SLC7A6OS n=1 Tax=Daphnia carinata TaxID=120202 RepID=UPI00257D253D|nr:probable RNA polymerase II nuclear localization protein SLC7A6OS [Daphnia carinata]
MTSIVRIKRRLSQEPIEALLLASKRMRVEDALSVEAHGIDENIFRFCGTTENEEENVENLAKLVQKGKLKSHRQPAKAYRSYQPKKQVDTAMPSSEKKYKVLNKIRNLDTTDSWKIYDLVLEEQQQCEVATCNGVPLLVEKCEVPKDESKCVFDVYYCEEGAFDDGYIDRLMSVQPYYYHPGEQEEESENNDTDDSNDESNWRNDYPDTDEEDEGDEDIVGKMCGMYLERDDELSSDDEDFVYSKDDCSVEDLYLKFKERAIRDLLDNVESDSCSADDCGEYY